MLIGYARVSTGDQSLTLQIDALQEARRERVFQMGIMLHLPNETSAISPIV